MPFLSRPGTLLDVGANFGQCTLGLLQVADARVVAFEPVTQTFLGMCVVVSRNFDGKLPKNLTTYNLGVGAEVGKATISVPYFEGIRWEGRASIVKDFGALAKETTNVAITHVTEDIVTVPLDMFEYQDVTFLKIDVEGFEKEVLQGAAQTIARCRPIIHIEIEEQHRPGATVEVPAMLKEMGYRGVFFLDDCLRDFADFSSAEMQKPPPLPKSGLPYPEPYIYEFVFVHQEDLWGLQKLAELGGFLLSKRAEAAASS